jgi:hypothetical protein
MELIPAHRKGLLRLRLRLRLRKRLRHELPRRLERRSTAFATEGAPIP